MENRKLKGMFSTGFGSLPSMSTGHSHSLGSPLVSLRCASLLPQFPGSVHSSGPLQPHCVSVWEYACVCTERIHSNLLSASGSLVCICNTMRCVCACAFRRWCCWRSCLFAEWGVCVWQTQTLSFKYKSLSQTLERFRLELRRNGNEAQTSQQTSTRWLWHTDQSHWEERLLSGNVTSSLACVYTLSHASTTSFQFLHVVETS